MKIKQLNNIVETVLTSSDNFLPTGKAVLDANAVLQSNIENVTADLAQEIIDRTAADALKISLTEKAQALGVATLDSSGTLVWSQVPQALLGATVYQGFWNASTNVPTIPTSSTANKGQYYIVNVAGSTNIDGITDWKVGDWIISNGTYWGKVDNTDSVISVNGHTGAVTLTLSDIIAVPIPISSGGTNAVSFVSPVGTLCPIVYFDGTSLKTDSTVADLGYDTSTDIFNVKQILASGGMTSNSSVFIHKSAISVNSTDGLTIENTSTATSGSNIQMSPRLKFKGAAWDTGSASSKTHNFKIELMPASGAGTSNRLVFANDAGGGSYSEAMSINSNGTVSVNTSPINSNDVVRKSELDSVNISLSGKEPTITAGTTSQYWRGDKTFQTLDKNAVGLSNVDNTTDLLKPISTATQNALNLKENISNKVTSFSSPTDVQYPSAKLVYDQLALKESLSNKATSWTSPNNTKYPTTLLVSNSINNLQGEIDNINNTLGSISGITVDGNYNVYVSAAGTTANGTLRNVAYGYGTLVSGSSNFDNTAIGHGSQQNNINGLRDTSVGSLSGISNTDGSDNTLIGYSAGSSTIGNNITAIGSYALYNFNSDNAIAIGYNAAYNLGAGDVIAIGNNVMYNTTSTSNMIAIGASALYNSTGTDCIAIGTGSLYSVTGTNAVAIGHQAGMNFGYANNCTFIGNIAGGYGNSTGSDSIYIGTNAASQPSSNAINEIVIGVNAVGNGSNSITLGNSSILKTFTKGILLHNIATNAGGDVIAHFHQPTANASGIFLTNNTYTSGNGLLLHTAGIGASIENSNGGYLDFRLTSGAGSRLMIIADANKTIKINGQYMSDSLIYIQSLTATTGTFVIPATYVLEYVTIKTNNTTTASIQIGSAAGLSDIVNTTTLPNVSNQTKRLVALVNPNEQFETATRTIYFTLTGSPINCSAYITVRRLIV